MYRQTPSDSTNRYLHQALSVRARLEHLAQTVIPVLRGTDVARYSLVTWADDRDKALSRRLKTRFGHLATRLKQNPHDIRLKYECEQASLYDKSHVRMAELLLKTGLSMQELRELRWIDVRATSTGLQVNLTSRGEVVSVPEGTFDGVPMLSIWVFSTASLSDFEREWHRICSKFIRAQNLLVAARENA